MSNSLEWIQETPGYWTLSPTIDGVSMSVFKTSNSGWGWTMLFVDSLGMPRGYDHMDTENRYDAMRLGKKAYLSLIEKAKENIYSIPPFIRPIFYDLKQNDQPKYRKCHNDREV